MSQKWQWEKHCATFQVCDWILLREMQEEIHSSMDAIAMVLIEGMDHEKYCQLCHLLQVVDLYEK